MMFGIPGAALAMVHTAKSNKKKAAIGLVSSAAIAAFVCGVTEPFEFGFMFLAPVLYLVYALLYGIADKHRSDRIISCSLYLIKINL